MNIIWSPQAVDRAVEEAEFIARDKPGAANRWLDGLFKVVDRLEVFPDKALYLLGRYHEESVSPDLACEYYARFLESQAPDHPLGESEYRFLRFLAPLFGLEPDRIDKDARQSIADIERKHVEWHAHAKRFVTRYRSRGGVNGDA